MQYIGIVVLGILCSGSWCIQDLKFPEWFQFGAASSSYQVEGGWNASDKGESTWDRLLHTKPEAAAEETNGDVACDSYHQWRRDIEIAEELGLDMYRFSISWPRLFPNGFVNYISQDGKNYYNDLINGLLAKGIKPVVTLYHFDLPQILQDLGGWTNPLITDWFADYARVAFGLFGDRVKIWLTELNEPFGICDVGYSMQQAPYLNDTKLGKYLCNKYTLIAHAKAWRIYDEEFRPQQKGKVSLATLFIWFEPAAPVDEESPTSPLNIGKGDMLTLSSLRKVAGLQLLKNTWQSKPSKKDMHIQDYRRLHLKKFNLLEIYPEGLRKQLHWLNTTYGVSEILITENGYLDFSQHLDDWGRLQYIRDNLKEVQLAIQDGLNITGYIVWTMMDNFEWLAGYKVNFGLYAVNFTDPQRTRTPRVSARYYSAITKTRSIYQADFKVNIVTQ